MYDLYRPEISELKHSNNAAEYGPNIASYAVRVVLQNSSNSTGLTLNNVASGIVVDRTLTFELKDYDNQTMVLDNVSDISIRSNQKDITVVNNMAKTTKGRASFESLLFTATPGSQNVSYSLQSTGVELDAARVQMGENYSLGNVIVNFRK